MAREKTNKLGKASNATAKSSRGASKTRQVTSRPGLIRNVLTVTAVCCVMISVALLIRHYKPLNKIESYANRPIAGVSIESEFRYLRQDDAQSLVAKYLSETFLELDIKALRDGVEAHVWVDTVTVSRRWPDRLVIKIVEQQPIARWGQGQFLNLRGDIVENETRVSLLDLPELSGLDHHAKEIMQQYLVFGKLLPAYGFAIEAVKLDETRAWTLVMQAKSLDTEKASGVVNVLLGRENTIEKVQRLMQVMQNSLIDEIHRIESIDMRYRNGFAVTWVEDEDASEDADVAFHSNLKEMPKALINKKVLADVMGVNNGNI